MALCWMNCGRWPTRVEERIVGKNNWTGSRWICAPHRECAVSPIPGATRRFVQNYTQSDLTRWQVAPSPAGRTRCRHHGRSPPGRTCCGNQQRPGAIGGTEHHRGESGSRRWPFAHAAVRGHVNVGTASGRGITEIFFAHSYIIRKRNHTAFVRPKPWRPSDPS